MLRASHVYSGSSRYASSFFGIVGLVSVLATFPRCLVPELHSLIDVRMLRLLRVFRILGSPGTLQGFRSSARRCVIAGVGSQCSSARCVVVVVSMGTGCVVVEEASNGFTASRSVYSAITTMTTVASATSRRDRSRPRGLRALMMLWWGVLAVPTASSRPR